MSGEDNTIEIPQVLVNVIPKVGQEFQSLEDAHEFYNNYARQAGFSTRVSNNKRNKETGEDVWKMFVCSKEGKTDESWQSRRKDTVEQSRERNRGHTRCGCKAKMTVKKSRKKDVWVVGYFIEQHNHALSTPTKVHLLRSHRSVSAAKRALVHQLSEANIPTCQQVRLLEIDAGGPSSIGFLEKDIRNHRRDLQSELLGHDAESLIQYFESEKEKNENFYSTYETNDSGVFVRCFWSDCESRRSYAQFGDVIVFDTTYNTNKYSMVFAPFVGVNHHRQTTVFGCGLLSDEKTDSFVWLFSKFLECMSGHDPPSVIITDQDAAIARAILQVLPSTLHRFCLWHILNKFSEKLGSVLYHENYHKLAHIIKESESSSEFEECWLQLMESTELKNNEWLSNLYTIRHRWVPAYVKDVFDVQWSKS